MTPDIKNGLCECYFDGGYANLNGVCTKCSEQNSSTNYVASNMTACVVKCADNEVLNNTNMFLCIPVDDCKAQKGQDGFYRVVSLDRKYCIDRTECTSATGTNGTIYNNTCVCGSMYDAYD